MKPKQKTHKWSVLKIRQRIKNPIWYVIIIFISFGLAVKSALAGYDGTKGPEMTKQTWPKGTFLANFPEGDRINTYHRNYLMINGQAGTGVWDVSNPTAPRRVEFSDDANNGHRWWKLEGDLFYREYSVPELQGTGYKYLDLSNMLDRKPVTSSDILYTVQDGQANYDNLETFPHTIVGSRVFDMRSGEQVDDIPVSASVPDVVVRVGNYVFYAPQTGDIKVFDFGDPSNIKFLGAFGGDIPHEQYSTGIQLWRNYLVFMSGNQGPDALVGFDISDPTNVKRGFSLHSDQITLGRYMIFQDEFGFSGRFDRGVKFNFETMEIDHEFFPPSSDETLQFIDNQWMPIGHILVASGDDKTSIFAHQDGLDTKGPSVGHHFPKSGAINQPITSTIGFVINETLDDLTLNDQTIQVRPLGGDLIKGDVTTTSYQVINYAPKEKLTPNTTYEVKFVEDGIKDAVGNGMEEYTFYFTTGGNSSNQSPEVTGVDLSIPSPITTGNKVTLTANATDPDGDALRYRWDFGDGSPKTTWTTEIIDHTYTEAGNYTIQVQVSDNNGGFAVASQAIVVSEQLPSTAPTQSGPIIVDEANRIVWSVNPDNNSVTLINADTFTILKEVSVGKDPISVALDSGGNAWVTCRDSDELYVLNDQGIVQKIISLDRGSRPYGIVFTPDQTRAFMSAFGSGEIIEINPNTGSVVNTLTVGDTPRALAITGDGAKLLVTRFISPDEEGQVWEINLNTQSQKTIALALDNFTVDNGNAARGLPNYVSGISIHPNNKSAWSVAKKDNIVRGLARDGKPLTFDNSVRTAISPINLTTSKEELNNRLDIDNHGQPSSALFSPTGNYLFITMQGNNRIVVVDPKTGIEILKKDVGKSPQGLAFDKSTNRLFVKNFMDRSVTVLDAAEMVNSGTTVLDNIRTVNTVTTEGLSAQVLKGKQIFYDAANLKMGTDGYVSCASCHLDGTQDGRTWDFTDRGEGLRNTISLVGRAGTAHGRVHWSANFDEIQDFENDIRNHFKGKGFMSTADFNEGTTALTLGDKKAGKSPDLDALTAYIKSLDEFEPSPYKNKNGALTADGIAGKAIFGDLKCASCHSGEQFTDSPSGKMHDVGTVETTSGNRLEKPLLGLDVPTLKDVWATAPYLHDGSAKTIKEVLTTRNVGDAHGAISTLSNTQIDQLVAYINQIDGEELNTTDTQILEVASPVNGSQIDTSDPVKLSVNTDITGITKIEYYVDNDLVSTASTAPFESAWQPIIWKNYTVTAKVFYNGGKTASITPESSVMFKNTINVMFVVGDKLNLSSEDQRIKSRLEQKLGFTITLFSDEETTSPQSANPFDLVLISSTVDPRELGNDLEGARVPLLTWNPFMYNKLRMTSGALNTGFGITSEGFDQVTITTPNHPMAAAAGTKTALYGITQSLPFGNPSDEAIIIAKAGIQPILFGYEASIAIPSRRTAFPLRDQFMHLLTEQGLKMFDAAVLWTLHGGDADTPIGPLPDVYFTSPTNGQLVNAPISIKFETEGWDLPSQQFQLRYRIDGQDRGLITKEGMHEDLTNLSEGPHELTLQMERSDNSPTELSDTITVMVTKDPIPEDPTVIIESPTDGGLVGPDFSIEFSTILWDITPGGRHIKYFLDDVAKDDIFTVAPISVVGLSEGKHTIKLALAEADGTLTGTFSEISVTVDKRLTNLPDTDFSVEYRDNSSGPVSVELKPVFQIVSDAEADVALQDFKIRYWFTPEHTASMAFNIDYAQPKGVTGQYGTLGSENYLELGFSSTSGTIKAKGKSGVIQTRLHHAGFQSHNQVNDFSYDSGKTSLKPHIMVTLYHKGKLVWGIEPDGSITGNRAPTAEFISNVSSGVRPLTVQFDASGSSDPDGDTLTYTWDFGDGTTGDGKIISYEYQQVGSYIVTLTVNDGTDQATAMRTITVTEEVVNRVPVAEFTVDVSSGLSPLTVQFDASSSSDPDGDALTYSWDFGDGTTGNAEITSHQYQQAGNYVATLTVSDGTDQATATKTITVTEEVVNRAPIADFTTDVNSGESPLTVQFDASGSSDPDGDVLTYSWDFGDSNSSTGISVSHNYTTPGAYTATLTVNDGSLEDTQTITITVSDTSGGPVSGCSFNTPSSSALPSMNTSFEHIFVLGNGPDLSMVRNFGINWDLNNNGLWQFSMNTNNGTPSWWIDFLPKITQNFNQAQPSISITNSGIPKLDGEYWVTLDGSNFVLVSKTKGFTIYFSSSSVKPNCETTTSKTDSAVTVSVVPNPASEFVTVSLQSKGEKSNSINQSGIIRIIDMNNQQVLIQSFMNEQKLQIPVYNLPQGLYVLEVRNTVTGILETKKIMIE
ncbi:PKD domain-containing protein [Tenacibaculum agarivorans]|uniref:PKD domain-containing protein n=1 Tax=Tenacibaculum agarivorans TaxID=1908389 RepID=UPI00094BA502|nr:PKD domain-containing protein [Tenacibaculum agarivorans]